ncbi:MAG: hypothetical protein IJH39_07960 [Clostridia bacterium]|nr:hypothetical protein [Clostridia bacterium]
MNRKAPEEVKGNTISVRLTNADLNKFKYLCVRTENTTSECLRLLINAKYSQLTGGI